MPQTLVPLDLSAPLAHPRAKLSEALAEGYDFTYDRWEGEDSWKKATSVCGFFSAQGWKTSVFEGTSDLWVGGKKKAEPYFRVYLIHPKDKELYAWWAPFTKANWQDVPKIDEMTWFELVQPEDKKEK